MNHQQTQLSLSTSGAVEYLVGMHMIFCANLVGVVSVLVQHLGVYLCNLYVEYSQFVLGQHFVCVMGIATCIIRQQ